MGMGNLMHLCSYRFVKLKVQLFDESYELENGLPDADTSTDL